MKATVNFTLIPIGVGVSLSEYVAACQQVLDEAGVDNVLHANGTNIEGEWDQVMAAVKRCFEVVHERGAPRIYATLSVSTRSDRDQSMADKIASVQEKLGN